MGVAQHRMMNHTGIMEYGWFGCGPSGVVERVDAGANCTYCDPFGIGCASAAVGDIAEAFRATVGSSTSYDKIPSKISPEGSQPVFIMPPISPAIP